MDYDSGYMSHNPDSNLDSSLESSTDNNYTKTGEPEKPVYISEDALLETPITKRDARTNISLAIEEENYEETRELFNTLGSVLNQENCLSGFNTNSPGTDVLVEVSPAAKTIIFDSRWQISSNLSIFNEVKNMRNKISDLTSLDFDCKITNLSETSNTENILPKDSLICSVPNKSIMSIPLISDSKEKVTTSKTDETANSLQQHIITSDNVANFTEELSLTSFEPLPEIKVPIGASTNDKLCESFHVLPGTLVENIETQQHTVHTNVSPQAELRPHYSESRKIVSSTAHKDISEEACELLLSSHILKEIKPISNLTSSVSLPKSSPIKIFPQISSLTPKKTYVNCVNPDISPDLFSDHETSPATNNLSKSVNDIAKEQYVVIKDKKILRRTQNSLKGVLPPRSVTVLQISVHEMLNQLESNKKFFWNNNSSTDCEKNNIVQSVLTSTAQSNMVVESKSLLVNGTMKEAKSDKFPDILKQRNMGLYHNRSKLSEEFEELCVKFAERYVGAETQSTCTVFEASSGSSSNSINGSPRKRGCGGIGGTSNKLRWTAKSPGRRLSHLARRRITFSSANLQAGGSLSAGNSRARQILVDAKKLDVLNIRRNLRKTPRKTPNKSPRKRTRTPSSSAKKKLALRFRSLAGEIESSGGSSCSQPNAIMSHSKRALFTSPDKKNKNANFLSTSLSQPSTNFESESFSINKKPAKRALFNSPLKKSPIKNILLGGDGGARSPFKRLDIPCCERKRKRDEADLDDTMTTTMTTIIPQSLKMQRSMSMDVVKPSTITADANQSSSSSFCRTKSDGSLSSSKPPPLQEMSALHKKKLQWAVYEALRAQNVTPAHAQFKVFASVLARVVRRLLYHLNSTSIISGSGSSSSGPLIGGSTSERMLRFAKRHSLAVVKGASVEEVIGEYTRRMRVKMQKPQGYIGIEEFNSIKDKENQIRDRSQTLESLEKRKLEELQKPKRVGDNRIDRIRKVINFGDDVR